MTVVAFFQLQTIAKLHCNYPPFIFLAFFVCLAHMEDCDMAYYFVLSSLPLDFFREITCNVTRKLFRITFRQRYKIIFSQLLFIVTQSLLLHVNVYIQMLLLS